MKAIFINIVVEKTSAIEQREALQTLREVVAVHEVADAEWRDRA